MRNHTKLVLAALTAALLLSFAAGSASADRALTMDPSETLVVFPELSFESAFGTLVCELTLHVTFHESVAKTPGALAGEVTAAFDEAGCSGGSAGLLSGVRGRRVAGLQGPYHLQHRSFSGALPDIESVSLNLVGLVFWIETGSFVCLSNNTISFTTTGGNPATGLLTNASRLPLYGGFLCPLASINLIAQGAVRPSVEIGLL